MTEEFIKTYVRLKPTAPDQRSILRNTTQQVIIAKQKEESYEFDAVFGGEVTNQTLFETAVLPIIPSILQGYNSCILAYGQTSSGKTYSIRGDEDNLGVIPLAIKQIFHRINQQKLMAKMYISYYEIYNENIIDLLNDVTNPPRYLEMREDNKKLLTILDLIEQEVSDEKQSLYYYEQGEGRRKFADNKINASSSRSHTIFRIQLDVVVGIEVLKSTVNLVDLAGSESISRTNAVGIQKKESENINKSLLALSNVIRAMSEKSNYVNYRDSKLTRILQPCLSSNSKNIIICTVQQMDDCLSETINTLRFGLAANKIRVGVKRNVIANEQQLKNIEMRTLLAEERELRREVEKDLSIRDVEIDKLRQRLSERESVIDQLKHQLLCQQNQNNNNDVLIQQLKMETKKENQSKSSLFEKEQNTVQEYEGQIRKLKETLMEKNAYIKTLQKDLAGLERNERTLVDKLNKYEKQLEHLQNTMMTYSAQRKDQAKANNSEVCTGRKGVNYESQAKKQEYFEMPIPKRQRNQLQNPYTIGKVIELSTRLLDLKIEINQYIKSNAELQQQVDQLNFRLEEKQNQRRGTQEDLRSEISRASDANKNMSSRQVQTLKRQNRMLKRANEDLKKKHVKYLKILKKNAKNHIDELQGFNAYILKNFPNPQSLFEMLMQEPAGDYAPLPIDRGRE